jgi:hypothetical protein
MGIVGDGGGEGNPTTCAGRIPSVDRQNPEPCGSGLRAIAGHEPRREAGGAGEGFGFLGFLVSLRLLLLPLAIVVCGLILPPQ